MSKTLPPAEVERRYYRLSRLVWNSWFASVYDAVVYPLRRLRTRAARLAEIKPGLRVIDVATGTGAQARAYGEAGATVVGVDLSPRMLAIARRKTSDPRVTFVEGDATALPFPDASFDAASVSFALHEMPATIRARVVTELARVTRPGAAIVVVDYGLPRNRVWRAIVEWFVHLYERDVYRDFVHSDVIALFAAAGITFHGDHHTRLGGSRILVGRRAADATDAVRHPRAMAGLTTSAA